MAAESAGNFLMTYDNNETIQNLRHCIGWKRLVAMKTPITPND
jgi:hypothetical protein